MNKMTIWQRLNTAMVILILLLLAGVGLALWVQEVRWTATHRSESLAKTRDAVQSDLVVMSDSVRGGLLDPKSETDKGRRKIAGEILRDHLEEIQKNNEDYPGLVAAVKNLRDFVLGPLGNFHTRALELAETEPANA